MTTNTQPQPPKQATFLEALDHAKGLENDTVPDNVSFYMEGGDVQGYMVICIKTHPGEPLSVEDVLGILDTNTAGMRKALIKSKMKGLGNGKDH